MRILLLLSFILQCLAIAVPFQRPLQEHMEDLDFQESDCSQGSNNETVCVKADFNPITDPKYGTSTQYCGYVTISPTTHGTYKLFFWLVMSDADDPDITKNPVVVWMNGGPGSSSLFGLWEQWGPRKFDHNFPDHVVFKDNPDSVTKRMSWIFVEQPAGVGYSTSSKPISDCDGVAEGFSVFIDAILKKTFNRGGTDITLLGRPLHIAGESFAGHYIPAIGSRLVKEGKIKDLNLKSFFVGNPVIDETAIYQGVWDMVCPLLKPPIKLVDPKPKDLADPDKLRRDMCKAHLAGIPDCLDAIEKCRVADLPHRAAECSLVGFACNWLTATLWENNFQVNPYFATRPLSDHLERRKYLNGPLVTFLNDPVQKTQFGVGKLQRKWEMGRQSMRDRFDESGDAYRSKAPFIEDILNAGIDFMLFAGDKDLVCPFTSVKEVASKISWTEKETDPNYMTRFPLKQDRFRACLAQDEIMYGKIRNQGRPEYANYVKAGHFFYATMLDTGHMIGDNHPENAAHFFNLWVFNRDVPGECVI